MTTTKFHFIISICLLFTFAASAGTPLNGTTAFNSVSLGVKASGNAGTAGGITAGNLEGFDFKLNTATSGPTMVIEVWDGYVGTGNGVAFYEASSAINPLFTGITITANEGSRFDLNSIGINAQGSAGGNTTVTITGLNALGVAISGATTTGMASVSSLTTFNVSANSAFKGVYGLRITSTDLVYAFIDNISLLNVTVTPLTWLDFSAKNIDKHILLNWSTASEQGTANFIIQRSTNGTDWDILGTTAAAGNSTNQKFYTYTDRSPFSGSNYYRLVQKDLDGNQSYSKIILLNRNNASFNFSVYPTLLTNGLLNVTLSKKASVQIYNSVGKLVMVKELQQGKQQLTLENLPSGMYRIRAATETISFIIP